MLFRGGGRTLLRIEVLRTGVVGNAIGSKLVQLGREVRIGIVAMPAPGSHYFNGAHNIVIMVPSVPLCAIGSQA